VILALYPANDLGSPCSIVTLDSWRPIAAEAGITPPRCDTPDTKVPSLIDRSALIGALHFAWLRFAPVRCAKPDIRFEEGPCLSLKRAEKHARAMTLDDGQNREHLANAFAIIRYAHGLLAANGTVMSVLLIPSRERVLFEWSRQHAGKTPRELAVLVQPELDLVRAFEDFFRENKIPSRDATSAVVAEFAGAIRRHEPFYPAQDDGHPFAQGYAAYAAAAASLLQESSSNR
jgi:hypothetical protein